MFRGIESLIFYEWNYSKSVHSHDIWISTKQQLKDMMERMHFKWHPPNKANILNMTLPNFLSHDIIVN